MPNASGVPLPSSVEVSNSMFSILNCNFTGRPKVTISWNYPSEIIGIVTSKHHGNTGLITAAGSLNITSVPKVCKTYNITCRAEHQFGKVEQSTALEVTGK